MGAREALHGTRERGSFRLLAELKRRDGAGNESPLFRPEDILDLLGNATWVLGVVFEVVQPDLQVIRGHDPAPAFQRQPAVCAAIQPSPWRNSGRLWRRRVRPAGSAARAIIPPTMHQADPLLIVSLLYLAIVVWLILRAVRQNAVHLR